MKRCMLIAFVFIVVAGVAARRFPDAFWSEKEDVSVKETATITEQETVSQETAVSEQPSFVVPEGDGAEPEEEVRLSNSETIVDVPFTAQAPFGEWDNPIFQNGCEEASLTMAHHWITGKPLTKDLAKKEITALSRFEEKWLGHSVDTSAADTEKLFREYYGYNATKLHYDISIGDMRKALANEMIILVPADGQKLKNPHFTRPGPVTHMLVIIGYDIGKKQFITNDPGTKNGKGYRYDEDILYAALRDYPTGKHAPIKKLRTAMITVASEEKESGILEEQ